MNGASTIRMRRCLIGCRNKGVTITSPSGTKTVKTTLNESDLFVPMTRQCSIRKTRSGRRRARALIWKKSRIGSYSNCIKRVFKGKRGKRRREMTRIWPIRIRRAYQVSWNMDKLWEVSSCKRKTGLPIDHECLIHKRLLKRKRMSKAKSK